MGWYGTVVTMHAAKAYRRSGGIALLILNLSTRWSECHDSNPGSSKFFTITNKHLSTSTSGEF
jgi:hypothetical protein